jgi:tRNA(Ile)-lysidine synthase
MTPEEILERVRAGGLLPPRERGGHRVLAMLSGGRDSVCLLDLAVIICGAERVHALHVNYMLRAEADEEERHCGELCERLGVVLEVVRAERPVGAGNLQAWAREIRYGEALRLARELDVRSGEEWLVGERQGDEWRDGERQGDAWREGERQGEEWREGERPVDDRPGSEDARGETLIATGHTATDQVETILYRLAASPGRRALLGMSPRTGRLVRPLLELTRQQTAAYCRVRDLPWREDPSNDSEQYARARVRNSLLPALDAVHPAARENVLRTARLLREEAEVLHNLVHAELGGESSIAIERLRALPAALARLVVVRLAEQAAGTYVPQAGDRVQEILALAERGGRAELHVGQLVGAVIEDGQLRMVRLPPRS